MSHVENSRRRRHDASFHLRQVNGRAHNRQATPNTVQNQPATDPFANDTFNPNNDPTPTVVANPAPVAATPTTTNTPTPTTPSPAANTPSNTPTTSSSSSSSTTTATTSTSSSTSSVVAVTPTTTATPLAPSFVTPTSTFFQTISAPASAASSNPSSTSTSAPVGGATAGIIAGGIVAAILGTAGIVFAVVYFLRRCRRNEDEALAEEIWNRPDARRQSTILPDELDPPVRSYNAMGRGSPRPPTMIERHLNRAPTMPTYQTPSNMYSNNGYGTGYGAMQYGQPPFSPGEVMSPTSANPFISPYAQDVMTSPVSSNIPDYHDVPSPVSPSPPPSALIRQPSNGMGQAAVVHQSSITGGPHSPVDASPDATDPHYVDLSRSSVTPFQAAQYAEISEKLRTPMSSAMVPTPGPIVPQDDASSARTLVSRTDLPPREQHAPTESPFANPDTKYPDVNTSHEIDTELPPLPSPVLPDHARIASTPPTLPEIQVPERSFSPVASLEFPIPLSARETPSPFSIEFSDVRTPPPAGLKYKNSPLATSSPTPAQPTVPPKTETEPVKRPASTYTVYDEEDAYGGI